MTRSGKGGLSLWVVLAAGPAGGCAQPVECDDLGGSVVGRFLYAIDESGTAADLHGVDARGEVMFAVGDGGTSITGELESPAWEVRESGVSADLLGVATLDGITAVAVGVDGTVIRSEDGGATWTAVDAGVAEGMALRAIAAVGTEAFAVVGDSAVYSTDAGQTWSKSTGLDGVSMRDVAVVEQTRLFAVGDEGRIARSEDGGATWAMGELESEFAQLDLRAVSFRGGGHGRLGARSGRILATEDAGQSWTSDGVVAGEVSAVALVSTETWVAAADGSALFYRHHTDPAYVEKVLETGADGYHDVRVTPGGDAVFVGDHGVVLRARLEYGQVPETCFGP